VTAGEDFPDETDDDGEVFVLLFPLFAAMAPNAERAFDEPLRESAVAVPLTSLSVSSVGSRLTNSFCSNWTTTYGRPYIERTLRPRAEINFTWIWPLAAGGVGELEVEPGVMAVEDEGADDRVGAVFRVVVGGGRMLKSGACKERWVVGRAEAKLAAAGVKGFVGVRSAGPRAVAEYEGLCVLRR
jgi:hypothetical protein